MSDLKVLRLVKKSEGDLPEKAFTAEAVAQPEPKPAVDPVPRPVSAPSIKPVPDRNRQSKKPHQRPNLSSVELSQIFLMMYLSRRLNNIQSQMNTPNTLFFPCNS